MNTIWDLNDGSGNRIHNFGDLARLGVYYFKNLFTDLKRNNLNSIMRLIHSFPRMVSPFEDEEFLMDINKIELLVVMNSFRKERSPSPDGWTFEFFLSFFDLLGDDILKMVLELKDKGMMPWNLNSTFISLIPKVDHLDTFGEFRPISLCNVLYKIVAKVIALRVKPLLYNYIFEEQLGFLNNRHIHEVVGVAQQTFHLVKTKGLNVFILKIELSKAYDKVSWTFLHLLLLHIVFSYNQQNGS